MYHGLPQLGWTNMKISRARKVMIVSLTIASISFLASKILENSLNIYSIIIFICSIIAILSLFITSVMNYKKQKK